MVLNFQVWLAEVCWMTDRKEALSVGQRVCVCVFCLNWSYLFIDRQLVLHLQLRKLKRMEGNSWWEYGTLQELRGNRTFSCCDQSASRCGVKIICFVETETFCTSRCARVFSCGVPLYHWCVMHVLPVHIHWWKHSAVCVQIGYDILNACCYICVLKFIALSCSILPVETRGFFYVRVSFSLFYFFAD